MFLNPEGIDETVKQVKSLGGRCNGYVVDISKKEEVYKAAEVIRKEIGNVSILKFKLFYQYTINLTYKLIIAVDLTFLWM